MAIGLVTVNLWVLLYLRFTRLTNTDGSLIDKKTEKKKNVFNVIWHIDWNIFTTPTNKISN